MKLYTVSTEYIDYLYSFDHNVLFNKKGMRPYVGILLEIKGNKFYAPLSSPKEKHKTMAESVDVFKIRKGFRGVVNLNNMIPVINSQIKKLNIESVSSEKYKQILYDQIRDLNKNERLIKRKAKIVYRVATSEPKSNEERKLKERCCKLNILMEKAVLFQTETGRNPAAVGETSLILTPELNLLAKQAREQLETTGKTTIVCPVCNKEPVLTTTPKGERSIVSCPCGRTYDCEIY